MRVIKTTIRGREYVGTYHPNYRGRWDGGVQIEPQEPAHIELDDQDLPEDLREEVIQEMWELISE